MSVGQTDKAAAFRALHQGPGAFVVPNPWDAGSARLFEGLGFKALATTSAGLAMSLGRRDGDGAIGRELALANARAIVDASSLPVSADFENGFGDDPDTVARTVRLAAEAGLVGCSIEDASGDPAMPIYDRALAVERVQAAVEAARAVPFPFTLTARAENFLHGRPSLADTVERLQAFEAVGADVLYAPGLRDLESITELCSAISAPVNVLVSSNNAELTVEQLQSAGARRISVGGALARVALGAAIDAARQIEREGRFDALADAAPFKALYGLMGYD